MKILHMRLPDFENEEDKMKAHMFILYTAAIVLKGKNELIDLWQESGETYTFVPNQVEETIMEKAEHLGITELLEGFMVFKTVE